MPSCQRLRRTLCGIRACAYELQEILWASLGAASDLLRRELNDLGLLGSEASANSKLLKEHLDADKGYWDLYSNHPVVQKAFQEGFRQEHVVPVSVYFDGV